jgi:hypothetical protein
MAAAGSFASPTTSRAAGPNIRIGEPADSRLVTRPVARTLRRGCRGQGIKTSFPRTWPSWLMR